MMKTTKYTFKKHVITSFLLVLALIALGGEAPTANAATDPNALPYPIVDTGQSVCYGDRFEMSCPEANSPYTGQDAQIAGNQPQYIDNGDGTVTDVVTGLMWQQALGEKKTFAEAQADAETFDLAGYRDWRLPSIKELWSLFLYSGSTARNLATTIPFLDDSVFEFGYGDESKGERFIDGQTWSSTEYVGRIMNNQAGVFGVNFVDGRIKGYPRDRAHQFARYVRGNPDYGTNDFVDNGDGTITDRATGLMWMQIDSGAFDAGPFRDGTMTWEEALAWAEDLEYTGYDDWHLPDGKQLQSIVDYTRSPGATNPTQQGPAIDPIFNVTNEQSYFWTNSTHVERNIGDKAAYVCFGQSLGYRPRPNGSTVLIDVHGAGAVRSDFKEGDPVDYPEGHGPQGDDIRIYNYVRCVRTLTSSPPVIITDPNDGVDPPDMNDVTAPTTQPNLIVFVADDMGWADVGYHGSDIETPTIDRLATEGVQLDRFYAWPTCSPTRFGLLTGRSPLRIGLSTPVGGKATWPPLEEHFLGQTLQAHGYQTWLCGKWHLGGRTDSRYLPNARGFDHFYGYLGGGIDYYTHTSDNGQLDWYRNGTLVEEEGYSTFLLAEEAIELITTRDPNRPFYLQLSFNACHTPLDAPDAYLTKYTHRSGQSRWVAAVIDAMDEAMASVLAAVDSAGLTDNTLVVFFSDNGAGRGSNLPLRGRKGEVYEGGIRLPAALYWPDVIPAYISDQVVAVTDIFPTVAEALGVTAAAPLPLDGTSHWEKIIGAQESSLVQDLVIQSGNAQAAILHDGWKLVQSPAENPTQWELFDISADPYEENDLSSVHPDLVSALSQRIQAQTDRLP